MPVRPTRFSKAFEILGVPLDMIGSCSWKNYQEILQRLEMVRQKLAEYQVPGNRLIDAHSFCWIMVSLWDIEETPVEYTKIQAAPVASTKPVFFENQNCAKQKTADDYIVEARRNQQIGAQAQFHVLRYEVERLSKQGRIDLAAQVEDVSSDPALGYDIKSFYADGSDKRIEVKAVSARDGQWRFYLTDNELEKSTALDGYVFALVSKMNSSNPHIWEIPAVQLPDDAIYPCTYLIYLESPK